MRCDETRTRGAIGGGATGSGARATGAGSPGRGCTIWLGILGAVIGQFVFGLFNITAGGTIGTIVMATVGAAILLFVVGLFKK